MAMSLESIRHGVSLAPPRNLVYGVQGVGKTTMLAQAPYPIVIPTEDGEGVIDVPRFPLAKGYGDVMEALYTLETTEHPYKTVCVDSLDWFEPMVWGQVVADNPVVSKAGGIASSIESYGYGKGYKMALDYWRWYIEAINRLRNDRGMMVIQTAHSVIKRFESPESDAYDKYELKLHHLASGLLQEHSDCVLFINYKVGVTEEKVGFDQKRKRAVGSGQRTMFTQERPAYSAKNRYSLPESIPFDKDGNYWGVLANHIPFLQTMGVEADTTAQPEPAQAEAAQTQTEGA